MSEIKPFFSVLFSFFSKWTHLRQKRSEGREGADTSTSCHFNKKSYLIWKPVDEYGLYLHYLMVFNELGPIFRINGDQNEPVLDRRLANVCTTCQLHVILIRKKLLDLETS